MDLNTINIEDLIPHRDRMKLIDEILSIDEDLAVTRSVVTEVWPFFDGQAIKSIILLELVAQTAGINNGLALINKYGMDSGKKGWLVGIKKSKFTIDAIPLNTTIITKVENSFKFDNFREIRGTNKIDDNIVGEVTLQVLEAD